MQIFEASTLVHQIGWSLIHSLWQDVLIGLRRFSCDDYSSGRHNLCFTYSPNRIARRGY
jgi:hypothetical protein